MIGPGCVGMGSAEPHISGNAPSAKRSSPDLMPRSLATPSQWGFAPGAAHHSLAGRASQFGN